MLDYIKYVATSADIAGAIMFLTMFMLVFVLAKWHADNSDFDFRKALLDPVTNVISFSRLGHFVCLTSSTGILLHETAKGRMTEWLFIGYMTAWAGTYIATKAINLKATGQVPPTQ